MDVKALEWVSNEAKALRAVKELKAKNLPVTEEAVKELYLKYGGLVIGLPETQLGVEEGVIMPPVMLPEEREKVVEKKKKK